MAPGKEYLFKFATKVTPGSVAAIDCRVDVNTFEHSSIEKMELNDIAVVELALDQQVVAESYQVNRGTGAFIVIDRLTNITVAAGMVIDVLEESSETKSDFSAFEVELNALVRKHFPHWDAKDISKLL